MYCICLRGVSQRAWGSAPHLPAGERLRDSGSREGGRDIVCVGTRGGDLLRQSPEVPRELRGPDYSYPGTNCLNLQCPTPNKPRMLCIFRGPDLTV